MSDESEIDAIAAKAGVAELADVLARSVEGRPVGIAVAALAQVLGHAMGFSGEQMSIDEAVKAITPILAQTFEMATQYRAQIEMMAQAEMKSAPTPLN